MIKNNTITLTLLSIILLLSIPVFASSDSFVTIALPEADYYNSTNLLLDINVNRPISSAYYSINGESNVSMKPVLIFSMENISESTVLDFSPYSNNGMMEGFNKPVYTPNGKYGGALIFDNYNSHVSVHDSDSLDVTRAFTISAWIYPNSTSIWPRHSPEKIIEKTGSYFLDLVKNSVDNKYYINFGFYGQTMCETGIPWNPLDYCIYMIPSISNIPVDQWTHVAGTYDGTTMRLFINGIEDNKQEWINVIIDNTTSPLTTIPITVNKTATPLLIGTDSSAAYTFNGMIDEVRVYNTSLALRPWVSVLNPNFEEPNTQPNASEYYSDFWRYEPCVEVPANLTCDPHLYWDTSVYRSSGHSLKIVNTHTEDLAWLAQNPNQFKPDVIGGVTYTESAWIRTANMDSEEDQGVRMFHLWWNSTWNNFADHYCNYTKQNYNNWTMITCTATAPIGAVKGDFVIELYGKGTLWIDDVNFTSSEPMPKWIVKGINTITVFAESEGIVNSDTKTFAVKQYPSYVNLSLNGLEDNVTLTYPNNLTAIYSTNVLTANMYRDGIDVSSENGTAMELGAGYYNYTVINPGNENYMGSSKTFFANITQAASSCSLTFDKTSPQIYGTEITATCSCNIGEVKLYRNNNDVTASENGIATLLQVGNWNYICNTTGNQNYSSSSETYSFTIEDTLPAPQISNIVVSGITQSTATVTWNTDLSSDSRLVISPVASYSNTSELTESHSISLSGMSAYTVYTFSVISCNAFEKCTTSPQEQFTTLSYSGGGGGGYYQPPSEPCKEDWVCTKWSSCIDGVSTRTCTDQNNCNTTENKPRESRKCRNPVKKNSLAATSESSENDNSENLQTPVIESSATPVGMFFGLGFNDLLNGTLGGFLAGTTVTFLRKKINRKGSNSKRKY